MNALIDEVAGEIRRRSLVQKGQRLMVAVSGGLDSMVLLEVMSRLASLPENSWSLVVAHFNHELRGKASVADERLVSRSASAWGWPCEIGRGNVRLKSREDKISLEMAGRELRHAFFADAARRLRVPTLALAHHADDQVELFWLRLFRGAGANGLAGMRWRGFSPVDPKLTLVRPFLGQWRRDLEQFAKGAKILFREDATNLNSSIPRNRIRRQLLPMLQRDYSTGLSRVLARQMELLAAEADYMEEQARLWRTSKTKQRFEDLPVALQRRCLRMELKDLGVSSDFELVEKLRLGKRVGVAPGHGLQRDDRGKVRPLRVEDLEFQAGETWLDLGEEGSLDFGSLLFKWRVRNRAPARLAPGRGKEWFDAEQVGRVIQVRHWRKGDRFEPVGMGAKPKLQDLFTNLKVPPTRRRSLAIATTAHGEIWWVEGMRIGEQFKVRPTTKRFLEWGWGLGP